MNNQLQRVNVHGFGRLFACQLSSREIRMLTIALAIHDGDDRASGGTSHTEAGATACRVLNPGPTVGRQSIDSRNVYGSGRPVVQKQRHNT